MSKLVSIELHDFQTHAHKVVGFSPTVNVLVGPNEAGKSTILRAIRWVVFNRPSGDSVFHWGKNECSVELTTETCVVTREKGSENTYQIDEDKPFRAVGTDVPNDVKEALRLDEINFQRQIDGPFWLTLTAGEIARAMNQVVDLSIIDVSMGNVASALRDANAQVKALTSLRSDARVRVGQLRWVEDVEADAREALQCEQEAARKLAEAETISGVVQQIEEAQAQSYAIPDPSEALPLIKRLNEIELERRSLNRLIVHLDSEEADLTSLRRQIKEAETEAKKAKPILCDRCGQPLPTKD